MTRGTFITFEGPEGSGKTTQIERLAAWLRSTGRDVVVTFEPGGTEIGSRIRELLFDLAHGEMTARTELLLMNAARAQHVEQVIEPALAAGQVVLSDRFAESSLAYQGFGRELGLEVVEPICDFATGGLKADLVLLLDLPVEEGLKRNRKLDGDLPASSESKNNRFEVAGLEFHRCVRQGFLALARREPQRFVVLDALRTADALEAEIRRAVAERMGLK
ncbi:MAG: dTMP kinase [Verrucomicrobia bacterium]|nr:dTMP kinase [Verrucomicrobiota bacterium]